MWDELAAAAAWLDPDIIIRAQTLSMDVDLSHSRNYGGTLSWFEQDKPASTRQPASVLGEPRWGEVVSPLQRPDERPDTKAVRSNSTFTNHGRPFLDAWRNEFL